MMRGLPLDTYCYALQQHDKLAFETVRLLDQLERALQLAVVLDQHFDVVELQKAD